MITTHPLRLAFPFHTAALALATAAALATLAPLARAQSSDPQLNTWMTSRSYARVWETNADKASGNAVATWPRAGLLNRAGTSQATATYSDVTRVAYSANYVYVYTTGLASYTMGPWYDTNGTTLFGMWPVNRGAIHQIPRNPSIPTTKSITRGVGGVLVNGVYLWNNGDAQSYNTATGQVSMQGGQGIWNRLAGPTEGPTFDSANAHQPGNGQYHNHINPRALRYQLGDAVTYDATTKTYAEATPTKHSPIIGWANDGLPIYGPYGYSNANSATSAVRRMTSGFTKRDGTLGTTNLASTGRTTLPTWAASVQNRSATLATTQYGPTTAVSAIGIFAEDYEYLGDLGKTQGTDFDLNRQNVRFCVTPEFPAGTYAYFTCIDATGASVFPDVIGQEFFGTPASNQGTVNAVTETVTDYARGGQASAITVTAVAASATSVLVSWTSVDGGTYSVSTSSDGTNFTALATALTSAGTTTTYSASVAANYFRVTLTAVATYDTAGNGAISGLNGTGTAPSTTTVGATGTARLINLATRAQIGGTAGTPIAGFVLSGASGATKRVVTRAIGPGLTAFGVTGAVADPSLTLVSNNTNLATNDNWLAVDASAFTAVGAFALTANSRDAALVSTLAPAAYSAVVGAGGGSGVALLEVYDADTATTPTARLINASTRAFVGTGEQVLIPGFVVSGTGTVKLLLRAAGPALTPFGVTGVLADPQLSLFSSASTTALATNDNWSSATNATAIAAAAASAGAFAFTSGSRDAALLVELPAGNYTATVSGVGGTTGTA
ncbi:MAG: hypothetical protein RLZZ15_1980, partial [Verrucomicrobiota bacterium]